MSSCAKCFKSDSISISLKDFPFYDILLSSKKLTHEELQLQILHISLRFKDNTYKCRIHWNRHNITVITFNVLTNLLNHNFDDLIKSF